MGIVQQLKKSLTEISTRLEQMQKEFQQFLSELGKESSKTLNAQANVEPERGLNLLEE